ncbi:hypothetical protein GCM10027615_75750 [Plantactinospora veratri]
MHRPGEEGTRGAAQPDHVEPEPLVGQLPGRAETAGVLAQWLGLLPQPAGQPGDVGEVVRDTAVAVVPDRAGEGQRELLGHPRLLC